jgi:hypothetical protein
LRLRVFERPATGGAFSPARMSLTSQVQTLYATARIAKKQSFDTKVASNDKSVPLLRGIDRGNEKFGRLRLQF